MEITSRTTQIEQGNMKGLASVTLGDFAVNNIKITEGNGKLYINFPTKKNGDEYEPIAFPVTADFREKLCECIMESYNTGDECKITYDCKQNLKISVKPHDDPESSIKGIASATLNDVFAIKGIKVIEGKKGLFVGMPNYKTNTDDFKDIVFPVTAEAREKLNSTVIQKYNNPIHYIGNTAYKDLGEKGELYYTSKLDSQSAEKLAEKLNQDGVKFSGKVTDGKTIIVINKKDFGALKQAEAASKEKPMQR